ncbi:RNA polymerase sigma factor [Desertivirga xinjiangensis]|uniref:RNA polymerase sigma factor n=1 Tax=Desertivirga xinjiangensis TaxID=539206 RepID=UPI00210D7ECF|nr:RNA polymerase sigma factor [Pedobacter xinjiangensis]
MKLSRRLTVDDLLEGCQRNDRKAQEQLYKTLAPRMLGVCMRYAKNIFEAEDMLQNGFTKVFQKISEYRSDGSFEGWIRRIMVNTAIEVYRKNQRMLEIVNIDEVNDTAQATFDINGLEAKDLLKIIQELSTGYRMVFNLYAIEGYTHKEIGEKLGISEGASKSQLSRARAILKEKINKMEGGRYAGYVG